MCMHMGKQPIKGGHCYVLDYGLSFTLSLSPLRFLEDILHILHILFSARSLTFLGGYPTHFAYSVQCQVPYVSWRIFYTFCIFCFVPGVEKQMCN